METNQFHNFFLNETTLPRNHMDRTVYVIQYFGSHHSNALIEMNFYLCTGIQSEWRKTDIVLVEKHIDTSSLPE